MTHALAATLLLLTMAGCTGTTSPSAFSGPWYDRHGAVLPDGEGEGELVLHVDRGPEHCDWQSVDFMNIAWPLGVAARRLNENVRQYVRDPNGAFDQRLARLLDTDASLPTDARPTGFHNDGWFLWLAPSDRDRFAYLVSEQEVERWPRNPQLAGCD